MSEKYHYIDVCILIDSETGTLPAIIETLRAFPEVGLVTATTGEHDVMALVRVTDPSALTEFVVKKLHTITGVIKTNTILCASALVAQSWLDTTNDITLS